MRPCLIAMTLCLMFSACGTKGDLYIPEQQYPQDPAPAAKPAPAATPAQTPDK